MSDWGPLWRGKEGALGGLTPGIRARGKAAREAALGLIGLPEEQALREGNRAGWPIRVGVLDGVPLPHRPDLVYTRVNLHVDGGVVTDVSIA